MKGFKLIKDDMTHHGFKYQLGLNVDTNEFNTYPECCKGGLYFIPEEKYVYDFYISRLYGTTVYDVTVPDDALLFKESIEKWKANKIIISNPRPFRSFIKELTYV